MGKGHKVTLCGKYNWTIVLPTKYLSIPYRKTDYGKNGWLDINLCFLERFLFEKYKIMWGQHISTTSLSPNLFSDDLYSYLDRYHFTPFCFIFSWLSLPLGTYTHFICCRNNFFLLKWITFCYFHPLLQLYDCLFFMYF